MLKKSLLFIICIIWFGVLALEILVYTPLRFRIWGEIALLEMGVSVLQDTLWIPIALLLPVYILLIAIQQVKNWYFKIPVIIVCLSILIWGSMQPTTFFQYQFILIPVLFFVAFFYMIKTKKIYFNLIMYLSVLLLLVFNYQTQLYPKIISDSGQIKTMSYNILVNQSLEKRKRFIETVRAEKPDIAFIQEINIHDRVLFRENLGDILPYQLWSEKHEDYYGGVILSKYPFNSTENIDIHTHYMDSHTNVNYAIILVNGKKVHLFNCHLYPSGHSFIQFVLGRMDIETFAKQTKLDYYRRKEEAKKIASIISEIDEAIILAGDLNDTPESYVYKQFSRYLENGYSKAGWGLGTTFGAYSLTGNISPKLDFLVFDFLRIDHIFCSDHFHVVHAKVISVNASDHKPQIVEMVPTW
jgi:endonuclease/exonuclease/phosphatase (EEP) superfamily protein YafD